MPTTARSPRRPHNPPRTITASEYRAALERNGEVWKVYNRRFNRFAFAAPARYAGWARAYLRRVAVLRAATVVLSGPEVRS